MNFPDTLDEDSISELSASLRDSNLLMDSHSDHQPPAPPNPPPPHSAAVASVIPQQRPLASCAAAVAAAAAAANAVASANAAASSSTSSDRYLSGSTLANHIANISIANTQMVSGEGSSSREDELNSEKGAVATCESASSSPPSRSRKRRPTGNGRPGGGGGSPPGSGDLSPGAECTFNSSSTILTNCDRNNMVRSASDNNTETGTRDRNQFLSCNNSDNNISAANNTNNSSINSNNCANNSTNNVSSVISSINDNNSPNINSNIDLNNIGAIGPSGSNSNNFNNNNNNNNNYGNGFTDNSSCNNKIMDNASMSDRLRFHDKTGTLVKLSNGGRTAERRRPLDEFNNAVVMSNRALRDNELFEVNIIICLYLNFIKD